MRCNGDQKKLYTLVNKLTKSQQETPLPDHESRAELVDNFGEFFVGKVEKIRTDIDNVMTAGAIPNELTYEQCENSSQSTFDSFRPLSLDEVKSLIMKCPSKYCLLDPAPTFIIKECIEVLLPYVTKIINLSLTNGTFPSCWKCSLVIPLLKKAGLERTFNNYRPVSNLKFLSKVVESAAIRQYWEYLSVNNQLPSKNAAYRKNHSTETILTRVYSDILCSMDEQKVVILTLLDLSAAFDTVDYDILDNIFEHKFKITSSAANWFHSYLRERKQRVIIDDVTSKECSLKCGVPQGSCAGPVTFISYISSLYDVIDSFGVNVGGYADDTQLYLSFKPTPDGLTEKETIHKMNNCISAVRTWMLQHKLKINDGKTEMIVIGGPIQTQKIKDCVITVGNAAVQPVKKIKNLGMIFDENVNMKDHINKVCQVGFYQLQKLKQIRKYLDRSTTEGLVHSFITCHIDYGNVMLYGLPDVSIDKLQRLQNAAARLIALKSRRDSISAILKDLHWLPVKFRIMFKICLLVYKCLNGCGPDYLKDLLAFKSQPRTLRSSSDDLKLQVPRMRTESFGKRSFKYAGPDLWNELPYYIRSCDTITAFKKRLKTFYFKEAFK